MTLAETHKSPALVPTTKNSTKLLILLGFVLYLFGIGYALTPSFPKILEGLHIMLTHPSRTDFDSFFWTGSLGTPFIHAGLALLAVILVYAITKTDIQGVQIAAALMVFGFSFYGKNILNMWFPMIGVVIHALINKKPIREVTALSFFVACLGPLFSTFAFGVEKLNPGSPKALLVGAVIAIIAGYLSAVFAAHYPKYHNGLLLFNAGLAAGFATVIVYAFMKAIGYGLEQPQYGDAYTHNHILLPIMVVVFLYFIMTGLLMNGLPQFLKLFWYKSEGIDHVKEFGFPACLINMGVVGIISIIYIFLIGGEVNGPVLACIGAVVGFSANGYTFRTHLPLLIGVGIGAFLTGGLNAATNGLPFIAGGFAKLSSRSMILAALFSCGVGPIVGRYGPIAGLVTGFIHSFFVSTIGVFHGWMVLYNNGFALGLLTVFLYPVFSKLKVKKPVPVADTNILELQDPLEMEQVELV